MRMKKPLKFEPEFAVPSVLFPYFVYPHPLRHNPVPFVWESCITRVQTPTQNRSKYLFIVFRQKLTSLDRDLSILFFTFSHIDYKDGDKSENKVKQNPTW